MGRVTFDTRRDCISLFSPPPSLNHLDVHLLDTGVALGTGGGDPLRMNTRFRIRMLEDLMRGMAGGADSGDGQSFFKKSHAVDTQRVIFQNPFLRDIVLERDFGAFMMAAAAKHGDIHGAGGRTGVGLRADVVVAVTGDADRRQLVPPRRGPSVQAQGVLFGLHNVADRA